MSNTIPELEKRVKKFKMDDNNLVFSSDDYGEIPQQEYTETLLNNQKKITRDLNQDGKQDVTTITVKSSLSKYKYTLSKANEQYQARQKPGNQHFIDKNYDHVSTRTFIQESFELAPTKVYPKPKPATTYEYALVTKSGRETETVAEFLKRANAWKSKDASDPKNKLFLAKTAADLKDLNPDLPKNLSPNSALTKVIKIQVTRRAGNP